MATYMGGKEGRREGKREGGREGVNDHSGVHMLTSSIQCNTRPFPRPPQTLNRSFVYPKAEDELV